MKVKLLIFITVVFWVTAAIQGSYKKLKLVKKASDCIESIIPHEDWGNGNGYLYDYIVNISLYQYNPLNHHDYLKWSRYERPDAWWAGYHSSDTIGLHHSVDPPILHNRRSHNSFET